MTPESVLELYFVPSRTYGKPHPRERRANYTIFQLARVAAKFTDVTADDSHPRDQRKTGVYFVRICARTSLALSSGQKPGKVGCKMNKNILKAMTVGLMCLTLCGTSLAAPGTPSARRAPRKAPVHQRTPEPRSERTRHAPTRHRARRAAQSKPAPRPAPAPRHPAPRPAPRHHRDSRPADAANWLTFGAAVLGGIVGGLIGAGN